MRPIFVISRTSISLPSLQLHDDLTLAYITIFTRMIRYEFGLYAHFWSSKNRVSHVAVTIAPDYPR